MSAQYLWVIAEATRDTAIMVLAATVLATLIGLPAGVFLATSRRGELLAAPWANLLLGAVVNATRSVPYIILVATLLPLVRLLMGTAIGLKAAIFTLTVAGAPFIARVIESAIREVEPGLSEAARAFGANPWQIIRKVLLAEALPGIVLGLTLAIVSLVGYSAMAGVVGGGGLGDVAWRYGYQRGETTVMFAIVLLLIILVQAIQSGGDRLAGRLNKRLRQG